MKADEPLEHSELDCPFRLDPRTATGGEIATCGLVGNLLRTADPIVCEVSRDACVACLDSTALSQPFLNRVFPSILSEACSRIVGSEHGDGSELSARARSLMEAADEAILGELDFAPERHDVCDVFVDCGGNADEMRRSIASLLEQRHVTLILHLVLSEDRSSEDDYRQLISDLTSVGNVEVHRSAGRGFVRSVHDLVPKTRSEFIAFQHRAGVSMPNRFSDLLRKLALSGADYAGSAMKTPKGLVSAKSPSNDFGESIPWPTLIFRRATFLDQGGFADRPGDEVAELLFRAKQSGARFVVSDVPSVELFEPWSVNDPHGPPQYGPPQYGPPQYSAQSGSLRHHAIGYPIEKVVCDVVVPIYGQLEFANPAIESVLEQEGAEAIVHLIDDESPEPVDELFRFWGTHPRVRLYRNHKNIGQYASFNNVSKYFETDLVAVQDGDDISMPNRLSLSGNLLRLAQADFFAAAMEQFGDAEMMSTLKESRRIRRSYYPFGKYYTYFAMNPTACFRVSLFRRLGGYTDLGGRERNRGGLDSEFMIRAAFSGARFAFSSSIVSRHRLHANAATRRADTGFGSANRRMALDECKRRLDLFRNATFDPRAFGSLGRYQELTTRIS